MVSISTERCSCLLYTAEVGLNDWQRWPFRIEGFDYEQGYSYKLKVGTSVVGVDEGYYTVQYLSLIHIFLMPAGRNNCRLFNVVSFRRKQKS